MVKRLGVVFMCLSLCLFLFISDRDVSQVQSRKRFALVTYCSCDKSGCALYEASNRLKDAYCRVHRCDHLVYTFTPHVAAPLEGEQSIFKDHVVFKGTSIAAMWGTVKSLLLALEDPRGYEWVFVTGGDQIIMNFSISPEQLLPKAASSLQYDLAIPCNGFPGYFGLMSPPLVRNTERSRKFVRRWWQASVRGNYLVEDQSVLNFEILRTLRDDLGYKSPSLSLFAKGNKCSSIIPMAAYDLMILQGAHRNNRLREWAGCNERVLGAWYGFPPFSSRVKGRKSSILLFEYFQTDGTCGSRVKMPQEECGYGWNFMSNQRGPGVFMVHLVGPEKDVSKVSTALLMFC
jgi:hypothetical protein